MFTQLVSSLLRSSFMVLYIHRKWMTYQGQEKKGVGNESPGPPPCSVHTARELRWTSSSFMVLYDHRNRMVYWGQEKKGVGNESPGPPPCSVHTAPEL